MRTAFARAMSCLVLLAAFCAIAPAARAQQAPGQMRPIVFVHGGSGSGAQFQSQALRFTSNGYPQNFIRALEYDSSAIQTILPNVLAQLDTLIAQLKAETGASQVDLVGHSLGTFVSQSYLSMPARAASVARYVNVDGRTASALPGGVPTLALFAGAARAVQGQIVGATNVTLPDQEHIEAVTSAGAFVEMFRFFTGREPATSSIVPATAPFPISGRAVIFPQNVGVGQDALVLLWLLDPTTGQRVNTFLGAFPFPVGLSAVDANGNFGPLQVDPGLQYELTLVRPDSAPHRFFFEPFLRADNLVRLNSGVQGQGLDAFVQRNTQHAALVITRNKEFRGDRGPALNDALLVDGTNVINEVTARSGFVGSPAAQFLFDVGSDGLSNLRSIPPPFGMIGFLSGADLFISADPPGAIEIMTVPRGNVQASRLLRIPKARSTEARVTVQLNDFEQ